MTSRAFVCAGTGARARARVFPVRVQEHELGFAFGLSGTIRHSPIPDQSCRALAPFPTLFPGFHEP